MYISYIRVRVNSILIDTEIQSSGPPEQKLQDCSLDCLQKSIGGVMVSMLTSSAIYRRFETQLGQTKDYKIGICYSVLR
jgi:hypothetical protein